MTFNQINKEQAREELIKLVNRFKENLDQYQKKFLRNYGRNSSLWEKNSSLIHIYMI